LNRATGDEVVWFDGDGLRRDQGGSGGGGVSAFNARPSWQNVDIPSVNPHSPKGRIVPDVAGNAAGSTGYIMIAPDPRNPTKSIPQVSGGTSASTPLWASLIARLQQAGKKVGFLPPKLYQASPTSGGQPVGAVAFRDITQGDNASGTAHGYFASTGFDAVTGWGTPKGKELLAKLP
jgi:kumamolisin